MLEGLFQPMHMIVILGIVMIIWGPGKLPELGEGLGKSIKAFKKVMSDVGLAVIFKFGSVTVNSLRASLLNWSI